MKRVLLLFLLLTPVLAEEYSLYSFSLKEFVSEYADALSSLSMAAIAAVGLNLALKKYFKHDSDAKSVTIITIALFLAIFLLIYNSALYQLFVPFVGYTLITGFGAVLFGVYKGLREAKLEPFDRLIGSFGSFFISWISFVLGLFFLGVIFSGIGVLMFLTAIPRLDKLGLSFGNKSKKSSDSEELKEEEDVEVVPKADYDSLLNDVINDFNKVVDDIVDVRERLVNLLEAMKI